MAPGRSVERVEWRGQRLSNPLRGALPPVRLVCQAWHGLSGISLIETQLLSESDGGSDLEVKVLWRPWMTGTPSQWQLRYREVSVGRKPEANLGPEAHEPHKGGRSRVSQRGMATPNVVYDAAHVVGAGLGEGHVPYPGRPTSLSTKRPMNRPVSGARFTKAPATMDGLRSSSVVAANGSAMRSRRRQGKPEDLGESAEAIVVRGDPPRRAEHQRRSTPNPSVRVRRR